ncbi:MAG: AAA family ATPase [Deltaproteobacteria bacterium]|nr:AAA family ATPase [Deltaproteobacteria bacterium]
MLYVFGGLPGVGKTELSMQLAKRIAAVHLRIDTIEQAMRDSGVRDIGPKGYNVAYKVAYDNLTLGLAVISDSVNPLNITRQAWRDVATQAGAKICEIEIICSDFTNHRRRVESRISTVQRLDLPTWEDVIEREYEKWDVEHIVIDTAGESPHESMMKLENQLGLS